MIIERTFTFFLYFKSIFSNTKFVPDQVMFIL